MIATLAIGIGANSAIFTVVSGVLLKPLPFADPATLVQVYETQPPTAATRGFDGPEVFQDFDEWRTQSRLLHGMVAYSNSTRKIQASGGLEQVPVTTAERGLFGLLGVGALLGRTFGHNDALNVTEASYGFWRTYLGADASAIGRTITLDGQPFTLTGVMPETFSSHTRPPQASSGFRGKRRRTCGAIPRAAWMQSWHG